MTLYGSDKRNLEKKAKLLFLSMSQAIPLELIDFPSIPYPW